MSQDLAKDTNIVYLGTPDISATVLMDLKNAGFSISGLFCRPDKETGRGKKIIPCPTKVMAEKYIIPVFQPKNKEELTKQVSKLKPDLMIVVAYGMILPKEVFDIPKFGILNIHYSLLPKYRGAAPYVASILNGDKKTGVTLMKMVEKLDEGDIVAQKEINLSGKETSATLLERLTKISSKILIEAIPKWVNGEINTIKQRGTATFTRMIKKEDGHIDWSKSALEIERQIRAFKPWPGSFTYWGKEKDKKISIKITQAKIGDQKNKYKVGEVFLDEDNKFSIQTNDGILVVEKLQLEGKKELSSEEFLRGYPDIIGSVLS